MILQKGINKSMEEKKFEAFTDTPTLTLEPFAEEETPAEVIKTEEETWNDSVLTEEEQKQAELFAQQIDITNTNMILQYGAGTQKKMADFSEAALENVRTKDLGEIGTLLEGVIGELKNFDEEEKEKGFFGFFKKASNKMEVMKARYDKVEVNIEKITSALEEHQVKLMKDIAILDKMYETNLTYFKELTMYVVAGKKKLVQIRENDLKQLLDKATRTNLPEDAQAAKDLEAFCNRFEKKIHDLELTKMIAMQTAPQIRLVQGNDTMMVEKIQSTIVNTIPLWKSQMVIALGVEDSLKASQAQRAVTDMTNELLKKNAQALKMASVEMARESERGIVDMETLKQTNESLIETFDEVMKIQEEGRQKRKEAEQEMYQLEQDLKQKLLQIHR